jgi:glucose-6-phosphate isomerase
MNLSKLQLWERFQKYYTDFPTLGLSIDLSRMMFADDFFPKMEPRMQKAFSAMNELEKGAIANPDEGRMVGHYWLRNPALAPTAEIRQAIEDTIAAIKSFVAQVHGGKISGESGPFKNLLLIGIGGSALGPQFVSHALGHPNSDRLRLFCFDNTDPDGMDRTLAAIGPELGVTLCLVISKSGGTQETRNGMLEAEAAYSRAGLTFSRHVVAVTRAGSNLDEYARQEGWIQRFPMWDWVGGRTSELSVVGLLPAALQGFGIEEFLAGARACDEITRRSSTENNPAAQIALTWFYAVNDTAAKNMVILPYNDRFELLSRYFQQLIMESIGKGLDLDGNVINEGICVFGNKGSTDQHSYIQQLIDGRNNFFVTFIEIMSERTDASPAVAPNVISGDYLHGFLLGTRQALWEHSRESLTVVLHEVSPFSVGVLIALYERAVGLYASLVNINAYNQPGVEAGKKAASNAIELQLRILEFLSRNAHLRFSATQIASNIQSSPEVETVFQICQHLAANRRYGVVRTTGRHPLDAEYAII